MFVQVYTRADIWCPFKVYNLCFLISASFACWDKRLLNCIIVVCVSVRGLNRDVRLHSGRSSSVEVEMYRRAGCQKSSHRREESFKTALYVMKWSLDIHTHNVQTAFLSPSLSLFPFFSLSLPCFPFINVSRATPISWECRLGHVFSRTWFDKQSLRFPIPAEHSSQSDRLLMGKFEYERCCDMFSIPSMAQRPGLCRDFPGFCALGCKGGGDPNSTRHSGQHWAVRHFGVSVPKHTYWPTNLERTW